MAETFYNKEEDVLNIQVKDSDYWKSIELPNGIIVDMARDGSIVAIEVIRASEVFVGDLKKVIEAATITAS
jgi:uncharacterized protein YuzE